MPTYEFPAGFYREYLRLNAGQRERFLRAVAGLVTALALSPPDFPPHLRVKRVQGHIGVWELTFAPDGRATFAYGDEVVAGEAHVIWRRIGNHSIFDSP